MLASRPRAQVAKPFQCLNVKLHGTNAAKPYSVPDFCKPWTIAALAEVSNYLQHCGLASGQRYAQYSPLRC
jgi:hypothetical protein